MTSYEKTRKQYAGSKEHQERCKFEAGLKWYMETKESTIRRIVPGFDGFNKDYRTNISYIQYEDEYMSYLHNGNAGKMGKQIALFEEKYKEVYKNRI